ncbi:HAD-IIIA family hydrolase [bacterium]|nr:HAD-IIIA family hydrolase [bacterium]
MTTENKYRALALIDRDGCLIEEKNYLADPEQVVLLPRAARAIELLQEQGVACVLCSNQSGVGRGYFDEDTMRAVHDRVVKELEAQGVSLDGAFYCPAHPEAKHEQYLTGLERRKPQPSMAIEARRELGLNDVPVFSIGDKVSDIEFGRAAGGTGILVRTGYGEKSEEELRQRQDDILVAPDVYDAARILLAELLKREANDETLSRKLRSLGQLRDMAAEAQVAGKKVVLANGCFDLLHGGHVSFIENSKAAGDILVLAVNSNTSINRLKGAGRPILPEHLRLQVLSGLESVDYLTIFYTNSADEVLEDLRPDVHSKGTDYRHDNVPELKTSRRLGIQTVIAGAPKENSTRDIIEVVVERAHAGTL